MIDSGSSRRPPRKNQPHVAKDRRQTGQAENFIRQDERMETGQRKRLLHIAGFSAVTALFKRRPESVLRLLYEDRLAPRVGEFCAMLSKQRRPYRIVPADELTKIAGTVLHGGIVAVAEAQPMLAFNPVRAGSWAKEGENLFILDGIGNPHNLGAIARSLAFFGFHRLAVSDNSVQAGLSDAAYRVAEGGLDCLGVYRIKDLPATLQRIKPAYRIIGTALGAQSLSLDKVKDLSGPVALILVAQCISNRSHSGSRISPAELISARFRQKKTRQRRVK